jgi:hypothetical protein
MKRDDETVTQFTMRKIREEIIEECAKVAEAQAQTFLSPQYASNQPFGSLCERFACEEVAKAIRALAQSPAVGKSKS